ncbi:MAG: bifunctional UDP-N-acetylglucosamine diphosphorylase/glucosamine-1-phosphate N-acetyltransferase GlmU [Gammaproteobacteria bacterium]|jgi:bifunctional UDP-N-acetylglucosamine pyrophosphorylase/glucosamine-1-phosphate N-acetyltransferase|nr:bifunctional UDP-N-acetylglucosamine diphosphorylase/glucosamine-1-phosphate N-acetyltransferase GlmU [Gammaproteobacteria bacterium]MBT4074997.1 bifunctional UDP-N-acetylglucosamine diphosphorylase/glucosamine-1-phosphate N-acetyltransferase GlmU [Gammaproteobacteria bacterium]MBT4194954.1 bifunctional UDP-N-acetylglucosamine diphosphorylase/glucosamine-1-phosphate N-acetyltransferase GlmU [Gammaproteobacteria bacterium]MBT4451659.1 bifunctional UDP-N-acetylglucosamine diphosphorylase/glucos
MSLSIVILAAGKGSRMKSNKPKVIHDVAGKPMLQHVVDTSKSLNPEQVIVVIGHESEQVIETMQGQNLIFVEQVEQLGTGHAVLQCHDELKPGNDILVLYGDVPLIRLTTLEELIVKGQKDNVVCLLSFDAANPTGYGRIVRDESGNVTAIVEEKDASDDVRKLTESNSGILYIRGSEYGELLSELDADNAQKEYYLTDVVKHAVNKNHNVAAVICGDESEVLGVNNQLQLAEIETIYRRRRAESLMSQGVKIVDPARIDIRAEVIAGQDVVIDVNCVLEGQIELEDGVEIGANCVLKDCKIGRNTKVQPMCIIDQSEIGENNDIGPFARIRPETKTLNKAKIGNFVEVKKSVIGEGSKVNHLTYIGDTEMGTDVNIGAGTITCNYDGAFKHKTIIEDGVFVGSDTQLVAPVRISKNTTIGAGSTITKDTPEGELSFSRAKQVSISGWIRPSKNK